MSAKPSNVLVVVPDADALRQLTGSLAFLSIKKFRVHVGVQCDPPGAQSLTWYDGLYTGLSVSVLPAAVRDRWRTLAAVLRPALDRLRATRQTSGWRAGVVRWFSGIERALPVPPSTLAAIEAQRPDVLVVTRLRGLDAPHIDYIRAARALRIPTVHVALGWDEVGHARLADEYPDCVALWNAAQRRDAVEAGVPLRRTSVIGAHLATDLLDDRAVAPREEYCRALGVDPARRLIVLALPRWNGDEAVAWAHTWNTARLASPATHDSHVIAVTRAPGDAEALRQLAPPGVAAVIAAEGNPYAAAQQLHAALEHADAVVTLDPAIAIEAFARMRPVLAFARHADDDLARLCRRVRQEGESPVVAASIEEQLAQLAALLSGRVDAGGLARARVFVRTHGNDVDPAFLLVTRLVREVVSSSPAIVSAPTVMRTTGRLAALARLVAAKSEELSPPLDGKVRFLMVFESAAALDHWSALMDAVVARGNRVTAVLISGPDQPAEHQGPRPSAISGISIDGASSPPRSSGLGRGLSALRIALSALDSSPAPEMVRWRRRLEAVDLPGWAGGVRVLARRPALLSAARRLTAVIDRRLPASRRAQRLVRGVRPGAVLALPSLTPAAAVAIGAAQADVLRAARARGLPVAAGLAGSGLPIDDALAAGALRPQGVNHVMADALAEDLERWIAPPHVGGRAGAGGLVIALGTAGALAAVVAAAAVAGASSAAARAVSRMVVRIRGGLGRVTRPRSS